MWIPPPTPRQWPCPEALESLWGPVFGLREQWGGAGTGRGLRHCQRRHQLRSQPGGIPASWSLRLLGRHPEAGRIPSPTGLCSLLLLSPALQAWCVSHRTSHYQMGKRAATGPSLLLLPAANLVLSVGGGDGVWTGPASQAAGAPGGL